MERATEASDRDWRGRSSLQQRRVTRPQASRRRSQAWEGVRERGSAAGQTEVSALSYIHLPTQWGGPSLIVVSCFFSHCAHTGGTRLAGCRLTRAGQVGPTHAPPLRQLSTRSQATAARAMATAADARGVKARRRRGRAAARVPTDSPSPAAQEARHAQRPQQACRVRGSGSRRGQPRRVRGARA